MQLANLRTPDSAERLRRLLRVADVALAHVSPERLLDELLVRVREILDADTAAVLLLDQRTNELVATAAKGLEEEVDRGVRIPVGRGFAGRIAAEGTPVVIRRVDHRNVLNPILREKGICSLAGVPMIVRGEVLGVLHVGTLEERVFSEHDVELLQLVAERVALAVHVRLYERERMVTEILQRTFLPEEMPRVPGLRLASRYLPASSAGGIGGDWYDVFLLPSGAVALAMGDVSGHGLRAASVMGRIRNALRASTLDRVDPADVVTRLDRLMGHLDVHDIVTLLFGVLEADLSEFRFVSAGHVPPLVVARAGSRFVGDGRGDPPLGAGRPHEFREHVVRLEPGASLLLYTDGLVERREESLSDGLERLRVGATAIREVRDPPAAIDSVVRALLGDSPPGDDVALLLLHIENDPSPRLDVRTAAEPEELVTVRRALRRWLFDLAVSRAICDDVLTAAGEATANVVEHAYGPIGGWLQVTGTLDDGSIVLRVRDGGRWRERRSGRGRGTMLMRATMDSVEFHRSTAGTTVTMRRGMGRR